MAAAVAAAVCALAPALILGGTAASATGLTLSHSAADDAAGPPPIPPVVSDPLPTTDPTPEPTTDPEPTATPDPTTDPEPTGTPVPTEDPAPATEVPVPVPVDPVPSDVPTEEPSQAPVESDSGSDSDSSGSDSDSSESDSDEATPVPTETPTPTPAPVVTATAAPAPVIELPFYPPPSAGTARDAFPYVIAGVAAAAVLLLGVATYVFTRWRLRRLRVSSGSASRRTPAPRLSGLTGFGHGAPSAATIAAGFALPWAASTNTVATEPSAGFALGLSPRAPVADPRSSSLDLGFARVADAGAATAPQANFALPFHREAAAGSGGSTGDFRVFDVPKSSADRVAALASRFGLSFGKRPPASPSASFDLGLPSTS